MQKQKHHLCECEHLEASTWRGRPASHTLTDTIQAPPAGSGHWSRACTSSSRAGAHPAEAFEGGLDVFHCGSGGHAAYVQLQGICRQAVQAGGQAVQERYRGENSGGKGKRGGVQ